MTTNNTVLRKFHITFRIISPVLLFGPEIQTKKPYFSIYKPGLHFDCVNVNNTALTNVNENHVSFSSNHGFFIRGLLFVQSCTTTGSPRQSIRSKQLMVVTPVVGVTADPTSASNTAVSTPCAHSIAGAKAESNCARSLSLPCRKLKQSAFP